MRFERLDLNLLVALDVLLEERQISRSADRLNLSQSAMSSALARLREFFDDELFVPVGRRMIATPRAESLAAPVRDVLLRIRATITARPMFDPASARRTFAIAMSDYLEVVLLPTMLRLLQERAPGLVLDILPTSADVAERMDLGHLDLLIGPELYLGDDHPRAKLFEDRHVCLTCREHPEIGTRMTYEQFYHFGHVMTVFGPTRARSVCWRYLHERGEAPRAEVVVQGFSTVPFLLAGTTRIAVVPERLAQMHAAMLPLRVVEPPVEFPPMFEFIQWRSLFTAEPGHQWLRELVSEAARLSEPVRRLHMV